MPGRILIGTCSWADRSLIDCGRFYPKKTMSSRDRLAFYAGQFPFVEIDSSYYAIPQLPHVQAWVETVPSGFVFDMKAYGMLTQHLVQPQTLPPSVRSLMPRGLMHRDRIPYAAAPAEVVDAVWAEFKAAAAPIAAAGKLGVLVFQFPPRFEAGDDHRAYLERLAERAAPYRVAVEFRNHSWLADPAAQRETFALLKAGGLCYVAVDEPQGFESSIPPVLEPTGPVAVIRLHGRNRATWERSGPTASDRFDYTYRTDELAEWVPRVRALVEAGIEVHLSVNTNKDDQGPANARLLMTLLPESVTVAPPPDAATTPTPGQLPLFG